MYILGIHGNLGKAEHDPAAVLLRDGDIVAAAEEERFVRFKHAIGLMPDAAIRFCLQQAKISMREVDVVAFPRATWADFPPRLEAYLRYTFGWAPPVVYIDHHTAHAASAYLISGFDDALIVTADQAGDGTSCAAFRSRGQELELLEAVPFPDSIGLFAALVTQYLGFRSNHDEYKVMGLAPYGNPTMDLTRLLHHVDGRPRLDPHALHPTVLQRHPVFHTDQLPMFATDELPGLPLRRLPDGELTAAHRDLAASAQQSITAALLGFVDRHRAGSDRRLCLAGGVAENSVAAGALAAAGGFDEVYMTPACGDAGTALGAALLVAAQHGHRPARLTHSQLGPSFTDGQIADVLRECGVPYVETADPAATAAELIAQQQIVAWFQGRMEFGPRALGARSLLADPSTDAMRAQVNRIKRREQFRPFGPSVLAEHLPALFPATVVAPFMSFTLPTRDPTPIIAATHVDGTSRPHTVPDDGSAYRRLIEHVHARTGTPAVLNTSLNSGWEPIVATPEQALAFLYSSTADALAIGPFLVTKHRATSNDASKERR
ncbi:carbamoyltransferase C-terminal domain-containing protein [Dactylosporangium sp. NPDC051485]|uniref:carbamoyltransferase family protein n=1 Tax=Dactylosporangium sp. NPDC051485 TaxID=3154846 RepID=UPI0034122021